MAVYQSLTLSEVSQDVHNNKSVVRILWQSQQTGQSHNYTPRDGSYWVRVGDGEETEYTVEDYTLPQYTNQTILDTTIEVPHDELGNATVTVRTWMNTNISAGVVELEKTLELTPIARATTLVASDAFIGATATIVCDRKSESYTHSVRYEFGELTGYIASSVGATSEEEVKLTATGIGFPIPESFYAQIPNSPSGICYLYCRTYSGDTQIGAEQEASFTVTARQSECCPIVTCSVMDVNEKTTALTGDSGRLVSGFSTARCSVSVTARNAASVEGIAVNGQAVEKELDIPNVETNTFQFVAVDSRGYIGTAVKTLDMIPYFPVTGVLTGTRNGPTSWEADITVRGNWWNGNFGVADNALTVRYRVGDGDWVEFAATTEGDSYTASVTVPGLDYTKNLTITVEVSDLLSTSTGSLLIKKGIPVFYWKEGSFHFEVPVECKKGLTGIYPVGAIYLSVTDTDPGTIFGGTWERLKDVFLLAGGDTYTPGMKGGEAAHTLSIDELPAHCHEGLYESTEGGLINWYGGTANRVVSGSKSAGASGSPDIYTGDAGGGMPHNNMPPYLAVYAWKRVS